jgi:hypothetical protein
MREGKERIPSRAVRSLSSSRNDKRLYFFASWPFDGTPHHPRMPRSGGRAAGVFEFICGKKPPWLMARRIGMVS